MPRLGAVAILAAALPQAVAAQRAWLIGLFRKANLQHVATLMRPHP
jgi:hypothetical protein